MIVLECITGKYRVQWIDRLDTSCYKINDVIGPQATWTENLVIYHVKDTNEHHHILKPVCACVRVLKNYSVRLLLIRDDMHDDEDDTTTRSSTVGGDGCLLLAIGAAIGAAAMLTLTIIAATAVCLHYRQPSLANKRVRNCRQFIVILYLHVGLNHISSQNAVQWVTSPYCKSFPINYYVTTVQGGPENETTMFDCSYLQNM